MQRTRKSERCLNNLGEVLFRNKVDKGCYIELRERKRNHVERTELHKRETLDAAERTVTLNTRCSAVKWNERGRCVQRGIIARELCEERFAEGNDEQQRQSEDVAFDNVLACSA